MLAGRAVDRVVIGEVVGLLDAHVAEGLARQPAELVAQVAHQALRRVGIDLFVVVT